MIILRVVLCLICTIVPLMLYAAEIMVTSVYFMILAGIILLISAALILSALYAPVGVGTVAGICFIIGIAGIALATIIGGVSLYSYKSLPSKATQSEQIKVPIKTKVVMEKKLKQKHS